MRRFKISLGLYFFHTPFNKRLYKYLICDFLLFTDKTKDQQPPH